MQSHTSESTDRVSAKPTDLSALAWVSDAVSKSLESSSKALRRYCKEVDAARGTDLASVDNSQLRLARQSIHQSVGALEMVGFGHAAMLLKGMEAVVQQFVSQPARFTESGVKVVEQAGFGLTEYLRQVLSGRDVSPLGLYPQYKEVQTLAGAERVHPADLWPHDWRWLDVPEVLGAEVLEYGPTVRARLDQDVLRVMKTGSPRAAAELRVVCQGLARHEKDHTNKRFWSISAGFFDALANQLVKPDLYVKRAASRILLQFTSLSKGNGVLASDRLAQDLLFFCMQAGDVNADQVPVLAAIRQAYRLSRYSPVDYERVRFGRFDPVQLSLGLKRIESLKEIWSSFAAGEIKRAKNAADQLGLVADSLHLLYPAASQLEASLRQVQVSSGLATQAPEPELAMEVATVALFLEATFEDFDADSPLLLERTQELAHRLSAVYQGQSAKPIASWMEELYRRVSDRQTMGTVVGELRANLNEAEGLLDQFFRSPSDLSSLSKVTALLGQMRGVLSVLGVYQASQAVDHMRQMVEHFMVRDEDGSSLSLNSQKVESLGNSMGVLGLLVDMLNYQSALAKNLFVFDADSGELKAIMGREDVQEDVILPEVIHVEDLKVESQPKNAVVSAPSHLNELVEVGDLASLQNSVQAERVLLPVSAPTVQLPPLEDIEDADLKEIFLEEAREVVASGLDALRGLESASTDEGLMTDLRRAFHTLKGSSRMVGLNEFGEAGWALEQLLNMWRSEQRSATAEMRELCTQALKALGEWVEDIAQSRQGGWSAAPFRTSADALRNEGKYMPLQFATAVPAVETMPVMEYEVPQQISEVSESGKWDMDALGSVGSPVFLSMDLAKPNSGDTEINPTGAAAVNLNFDFSEEKSVPLDVFSLEQESTPKPTPRLVEPEFSIDALNLPSLSHNTEKSEGSSGISLPPSTEAAKVVASVNAFDLNFDFESPLGSQTDLTPKESAVPQTLQLRADSHVKPEISSFDLADMPLPDLELELDLSDVRHSIEAVDSVLEDWGDESHPVELLEREGVIAEGMLDLEFKELNALSSMLGSSLQDNEAKSIGDLQISDALYNVYMSEAEEWAAQLEAALGILLEGSDGAAHELAVARAHSLAGSSGTVGFEALSSLARSMEHALQRLQVHGMHSRAQIETLQRGSDQVSYLLHQFAAGFLKKADASVLTAIEALHGLPELMQSEESTLQEIDFSIEAEEHTLASLSNSVTEPVSAPDAFKELLVEPGVLTHDVLEATPKAITVSENSVVQVDDFDVVDVFDADLFPIFEEEATDLFPMLASALREWVARPEDTAPRAQVLRALHTLKGSARLAGAMRLGELAHRMESDIESLGGDELTATSVEPMLSELDNLQALFEKSQELAANAPAEQPEDVTAAVLPAAAFHEPLVSVKLAEASIEAPLMAVVADVPSGEVAEPAPLVIVNDRAKSNQAVRVRAPLLDKLVNEAGEVTISRTRMETKLNQLRSSVKDITGSLDRLRRQLRDMELQTETQMQSRLQQTQSTSQNFDPLEFDRFTRVQEITRSMAESVDDISTLQRTLQRAVESVEDDLASQAAMTRSLQQNLLRTRMMEFETLSERLYRVVRQASKESSKQVKLDIAGGSIEIDRNMLERMTPAFEHLLRNSVAHGIEEPEIRRAKGKDATGTITIVVTQAGNDVAVEIRDDGAGLNAAAIRAKALERGLITPEHELTPAEVGQMIFSPGFSTASQVTELAGRGVGMDVVRNEVQSLGGRIETRYAADLGSSFKLILPLTTAMTQVVMVRMGETVVGVPSSVVEIVRNLSREEMAVCYQTGSYEYNKEKIDFFWGGALLQDSPRSMDQAEKGLPVMVFRSASQQIAVHVDEIIGNHEVVVKNLGPQLSRLPGLAAMTVLPEGDVALVYNPVALASVYGERARHLTVALDAEVNVPTVQDNSPALIMVVDDSITVRRVTQRFLQREGFRVELANDGLQALEKLRLERPTLVLSDIEMPRMDGFDLLRNIRSDESLSDLPVIMITSRIAEKHREHAQELGANHYLGKPYSEDMLLALVRSYAKGERPAFA